MDQTNPVPSLQHIFVSYSWVDRQTVDAIVAHLRNDGFSVWIDRGSIHVGEQWATEIVEAVDKAYTFLLMLSPAAVGSINVHQEVSLAFDGKKAILPMKLAPVEIPNSLRYQLAGLQWIEYYRDPDATYAELASVLKSRKPGPTQTTLAVAFILQGLNRFNFSLEKQSQLLDSIAHYTGTPRAEFEITKSVDMGGQIDVKMPAEAAYRLKTAALNSDMRLINYGIKGLRLAGDRDLVLVKSGRFTPLKSGNFGAGLTSGGWIAGRLALAAVSILLLYLLLHPGNSSQVPFSATTSQTLTNTPTATKTFAPTASITPTGTPTPTAPTRTPSHTPSVTATRSPTAVAFSFGTPQLSTKQLFFQGSGCSPNSTTIRVSAQPLSAIKVVVFFHKLHGATQWSSGIAMNYEGNGIYSLSVTGDKLSEDWGITGQASMSYQFVIQPINGSNFNSDVYTDLTLLPCNYDFQEMLLVPANGREVYTTKPLELGVTYTFKASGTISDGNKLADAEYTDLSNAPQNYCAKPYGGDTISFDVGVGGINESDFKARSWGSYHQNHVYIVDYISEFTGQGFFYYFDCNNRDNSGNIKIEIYRKIR